MTTQKKRSKAWGCGAKNGWASIFFSKTRTTATCSPTSPKQTIWPETWDQQTCARWLGCQDSSTTAMCLDTSAEKTAYSGDGICLAEQARSGPPSGWSPASALPSSRLSNRGVPSGLFGQHGGGSPGGSRELDLRHRRADRKRHRLAGAEEVSRALPSSAASGPVCGEVRRVQNPSENTARCAARFQKEHRLRSLLR